MHVRVGLDREGERDRSLKLPFLSLTRERERESVCVWEQATTAHNTTEDSTT